MTTSAEAFEQVVRVPARRGAADEVDVVPEKPNKVTVKGRVLDFPNNTGIDGGTLRVYRLDSETGQRAKRAARLREGA